MGYSHPNQRRTRATSLLLVFALVAGGAASPTREPDVREPSAAELMDSLMWGPEPVKTAFELIDHQGTLRKREEFRGKLLIVYFGYMFCPDICPTDLQVIAQAVDQLGPAGNAVQPLFITIDPERDSPERMAGYVPLFHPRLIGLTGSPGDIRRITDGYKVYFAKVPEVSMSTYVLDHSAFIYLVDTEGRYAGFLPPGTTADRLVEAIRPHLANASR
jgi:protein SCO1